MDWGTFQGNYAYMFLLLILLTVGAFVIGMTIGYAWIQLRSLYKGIRRLRVFHKNKEHTQEIAPRRGEGDRLAKPRLSRARKSWARSGSCLKPLST